MVEHGGVVNRHVMPSEVGAGLIADLADPGGRRLVMTEKRGIVRGK